MASTTTSTISLPELATELRITCIELAGRVEALIEEHGEAAVIAETVRTRTNARVYEYRRVLTSWAAALLRPVQAPTATCGRCGRTLTARRSVAAGYGRACQTRITVAAKAAAATCQPVQVAKAVELVEVGGVVRADRPATYLAVSSDGATVYRVDRAAGTCTCPAGQHGRACYHLAAAHILTAA